MRAITAAKIIKNAYSNASFSSVTAVTESLGLSATTASKRQFESRTGRWVGRGGGRTPGHYARALRCNTAGPFQICFLRACINDAHVLLSSNDNSLTKVYGVH